MKKFNSRLTILLISNAIIVMASAMIGPIYAAFVAKNIGGDLLEVGASYAVYAITSGGIMLLSGKFADKWRKEKLIMNLGYLIMSFAFFGYIFVNSLQELLFIQIMLGFGQAIYIPSYDSLYSQNLEKGSFATGWGADEAKGYISEAIGAFIGGVIAYKFGFTTLFILMGSFTLLAMVYSEIKFPTQKPRDYTKERERFH